MTTHIKIRKTLLLLTLTTNQALASGFYLGAGYQNMVFDPPANTPNGTTAHGQSTHDDSLAAYTIKAGMNFHPNYTWEGRLGVSLAKEEEKTANSSDLVNIDRTLGLYNKWSPNLTSGIDPYVIFGITGIERSTQATDAAASTSTTKIDFSYGAGIDLFISDHSTLGIEFLRLYQREDTTMDSISLGLNIGF